MPDSYYTPGPARAQRVNDLFAAIAARYDLINDLQSFGLHRYWKRRVIRESRPKTGERALDLCCGTGDIALRLAEKGVEVIGLDFSERMLAIARKRQSGLTGVLPQIEFLSGDAQNIPFADSSFDIITIGYGLRNLTSWEGGLVEMQRVA